MSRTVPAWLRGICLDERMLAAEVHGSVFFQSASMPVANSGRFDLGPHGSAFFDEFDRRLVAAGKTLPQVLAAANGGDTPAKINPLEFLTSQILRGTLLVLQLAPAALRSPNVYLLNELRRFVPPNVLLVVIVDLPASTLANTIPTPTAQSGTAAELVQGESMDVQVLATTRYTKVVCT